MSNIRSRRVMKVADGPKDAGHRGSGEIKRVHIKRRSVRLPNGTGRIACGWLDRCVLSRLTNNCDQTKPTDNLTS